MHAELTGGALHRVQAVGVLPSDLFKQLHLVSPSIGLPVRYADRVGHLGSAGAKSNAQSGPNQSSKISYFWVRNSFKCFAVASAIDCSFLLPDRCLFTEYAQRTLVELTSIS